LNNFAYVGTRATGTEAGAYLIVPPGWREAGAAKFPPLDVSPFKIAGVRDTRDPLRFFELTSFYTDINRPPVEDVHLNAMFSSIGIGPGATLPEDPVLRTAIAAGPEPSHHLRPCPRWPLYRNPRCECNTWSRYNFPKIVASAAPVMPSNLSHCITDESRHPSLKRQVVLQAFAHK
jgi:hypothetical protein